MMTIIAVSNIGKQAYGTIGGVSRRIKKGLCQGVTQSRMKMYFRETFKVWGWICFVSIGCNTLRRLLTTFEVFQR